MICLEKKLQEQSLRLSLSLPNLAHIKRSLI
jgi:hypothetical protein